MAGVCKSQLPIRNGKVLSFPLLAGDTPFLKQQHKKIIGKNFFTDLYKAHD